MVLCFEQTEFLIVILTLTYEDNKCVWDFAGDGWVHRLVLNESDSPSDVHAHAQEWNESEGVDPGSEEGPQGGEGLLRGSPRNPLPLPPRGGSTSNIGGFTPSDYSRISRSTDINTNSSTNHRSLNGDEHRLKLVEIPDPHSQAGHRSRVMPLTGSQEELAVNR
jgi:hypothetical protein